MATTWVQGFLFSRGLGVGAFLGVLFAPNRERDADYLTKRADEGRICQKKAKELA